MSYPAYDKFYIDCPFEEKDEAKALGARWDANARSWYYVNAKDADKFKKWLPEEDAASKLPDLSDEQEELIRLASEGKNVLVDACIGSGKTTTIQALCTRLKDKSILYLTYNRLLKVDAKEKIKNKNVFVQNYHGMASVCLKRAGKTAGINDLIQAFNREKPPLNRMYDVLVLDEYQDIELELAEMLEIIKSYNPNMQIIAVGDMAQKIYDKTTLNVPEFINNFLGDYQQLFFTKCFRLSSGLASRLGKIWNKEINGVNENCDVSEMTAGEVVPFLFEQNPSDILCLGSRNGLMTTVLNSLEDCCPEKFNKKTVYASIDDEDRGSVSPDKEKAIFTTFDSSKGLERPICVIFDYDLEYWVQRVDRAMTKSEIVRNIFCVAASRGKRQIIFVENEGHNKLDDLELSTPRSTKKDFQEPFNMSEMFSFKYKEDVEACYALLETKKINNDSNDSKGIIGIKSSDYMIDLAPCIGIYQEATFFEDYDIDSEIKFTEAMHRDRPPIKYKEDASLDEKILLLAAYETNQHRYATQVESPFVSEEQNEEIKSRLSSVFNGKETVQEDCEIRFFDEAGEMCMMKGRADVLKDDIVYELKFVSDLSHEHYLQVAAYMIALRLEKGVVWNTQNNDMYEVAIPDRKKFFDAVIKCISKGAIKSYHPLCRDITKLKKKKKLKTEETSA